FGADQHHDDGAQRGGGQLPETVALLARQQFPSLGGGQFRPSGPDGMAGLKAMNHERQRGQGDNQEEEERLVVDQGTDQRHLAPAGGQDASLRQLVQTGNGKLHGDDGQDQGSYGEEFAQLHFQAAFEEGDAQPDGKAEPDQTAHEIQQFARTERDGRQEQRGLNPFAPHHQENKQEERQGAGARRSGGNLRQAHLDLLLHSLAGPPHPDDHGGDEHRARDKQPALVSLLGDLETMDEVSRNKAGQNGRKDAPVNDPAPGLAPGFLEPAQNDPNDEGSFDSLPERDHQRLKHLAGLQAESGLLFATCLPTDDRRTKAGLSTI